MEDRELMKNMHQDILLTQIKLKKRIMYMRANLFGRTHSSVVTCSQELDTLLNKYQGI
ncbi:aspartyl-phosphate phosphatase Spo0E family protein [Paenisporosarcina antarctica]|nr:aspartyl-phosphate phosphatase Spo0E family protein [Paenisporosarcina antarctica]